MNKHINLNNIRFSLIVVLAVLVLAGCGEKPVSAASSSTPTQTTVTSEPEVTTTVTTETPTPTAMETPTAVPTTTVSVTTTDFTIVGNFELPKEDRDEFERLEKTHILPFLDGYYIVEKQIGIKGNQGGGVRDYKFVYVCEKNGDSRVTLEFVSCRGMYLLDRKEDRIVYDYITTEKKIDGKWIIIGEYRNIRGITNYID